MIPETSDVNNFRAKNWSFSTNASTNLRSTKLWRGYGGVMAWIQIYAVPVARVARRKKNKKPFFPSLQTRCKVDSRHGGRKKYALSRARARVMSQEGWPRARTAMYPRINIYICTHTRRRDPRVYARVSFRRREKKKKGFTFHAAGFYAAASTRSRKISFFF